MSECISERKRKYIIEDIMVANVAEERQRTEQKNVIATATERL